MCNRPGQAWRRGQRGTTVALLQLVERRRGQTHKTGPLLTQSCHRRRLRFVSCREGKRTPDRHLGELLFRWLSMELSLKAYLAAISVTVRKQVESSANELTR